MKIVFSFFILFISTQSFAKDYCNKILQSEYGISSGSISNKGTGAVFLRDRDARLIKDDHNRLAAVESSHDNKHSQSRLEFGYAADGTCYPREYTRSDSVPESSSVTNETIWDMDTCQKLSTIESELKTCGTINNKIKKALGPDYKQLIADYNVGSSERDFKEDLASVANRIYGKCISQPIVRQMMADKDVISQLKTTSKVKTSSRMKTTRSAR
jgi:hypothetical protein